MNPKGESPLTGIICLWSGAIVDIPDGWYLCDGTHGTPDLTDRFIIGAGSSYAVDDTGGAVSHDHNIQVNGPVGATGGFSLTTDVTSHIPPYYALAYIMKS